MSNRITLADLSAVTAQALSAAPVDQLAMLQDDLADAQTDLKAKAGKINEALALRYGESAAGKRKASGKDTGTVTLADGEFQCTADLPKKVGWDQAKLAKAVATLRAWAESPDDYVTTEIKISETKYNAWPPAIRDLFAPARTVSAGNPTFKLTPAKGAKK